MAITNDGPRKIQQIFADRGVHIAPMMARFLDSLLGRERIVSREKLIDRLWGDDPEGGPLYAENCVKVYKHRAMDAIGRAGIPWSIETIQTVGYRLRYTEISRPLMRVYARAEPIDGCYNREQAADFLNTTTTWLYCMHQRGAGPKCRRVQRGKQRWEYREEDLIAWQRQEGRHARLAA